MPTPSPRIICAAPAPCQMISLPTTICSRSSYRCFIAARSTRSSSLIWRLPNSKLKHLSDDIPDDIPNPPDDIPEDTMEAAIDRIMQTYDLLMNRSAAANAEAREKVTQYLATLFEAGERDSHRLTVCGLTYLRELDGSNDPIKAGF